MRLHYCRDTFRRYVAQDAHFLHFFARAYAAALDKCSGLAPEARLTIQQLMMGGELRAFSHRCLLRAGRPAIQEHRTMQSAWDKERLQLPRGLCSCSAVVPLLVSHKKRSRRCRSAGQNQRPGNSKTIVSRCNQPPHTLLSRDPLIVAATAVAVHMELRLHGSYARSWGVDLGALEEVDPATSAYTDFLLEVAEDPEVGAHWCVCVSVCACASV
jgi:hypothetical protein